MNVRNSTSPNQPSAFELDRERVEEHDLDVEEDEQHRREVEADREAPVLARRPLGDAGLERHQPLLRPRRRVASRRGTSPAIIVAGITAAKKA